MGRRLSAVICAAVLALAVAGCGDDSDDEPTTENTSQSDPTSEDDADDTTEPADDAEDTTEDDDDHKGKGHHKHKKNNKDDDDAEDDGDDNGAIPDDLESDEPDDPDDLPIDAQVVLDTCESVEPKDTWPGIDEVSFDGGDENVVATADVEMKGGQTLTIVCDISGTDSNPQVNVYNPI